MGGVSKFTPEELAELKIFDRKIDLEYSRVKNKIDKVKEPRRPYEKRPPGMTLQEYNHNYNREYYKAHAEERKAANKANREKKKAAIRLASDNSTQENI